MPMLRSVVSLAIECLFIGTCSAATILPVGPIAFSTNADYDANFKEASTFNRISWTSGYLDLFGSPTATAVFDTSATGGVNGQGGTGGSDANNDLSDFTISADVASSVSNGIGAGFLLRLNSSEAGGYLAAVHAQGSNGVVFSVNEGASLTSSGHQIYSQLVTLSGLTMSPYAFYPFQVTISGGSFSFDFASHGATASFTDNTVTATTGQVGILMDTVGPNAGTRMDNLAIVPEPNSNLLIGLCVIACLGLRIYRGLNGLSLPDRFYRWRQVQYASERPPAARSSASETT